jgi:DNA polymerase-1
LAKKKQKPAKQTTLSFLAEEAEPSSDSPNSAQTQSDLAGRDALGEEAVVDDALDPADLTGKRIFVLDSHSLIYQVFHAIGEMTGPDGQAVNAIFGFTRDLLDVMDRWKPDLLFAVFDYSDVTFRNEFFPEYKAHREPMPDDLRSQIPEIQKLLEALAIPVLVLEGFEADDILATLARETEARGGRCVLVTSDKDCRQLITDKVQLLNLRKGNLYGADDLQKDWGIRPDQVVDFQAMVGDSTDNVPGIPSIGPKTATQLLEQFGNLDAVLEGWADIKGKKGEKIRDSRDLALLSRRLVKLDDQVPVEIPWDNARLGGMDVPKAVAFCESKGFRSLTDRVSRLAPRTRAPKKWVANYRTVDTMAELRKVIEAARAKGVFSFDTETTSTMPRWADLVGASLAWQPGEAVYIPVRAPAGTATVDESELVEAFRELLQDPKQLMIGQNLKYDLVVLRSLGLEAQAQLFDTMVADYLINPGRTTHNMDDLALRFLQHKTIKIDELIGRGKNQGLMSDVAIDRITQYAAEDADVPLRLQPVLERQLRDEGLLPLFESIEMPLVTVLAEMEYHGITVDRKVLADISVEFGRRLEELRSHVIELAGEEFNLDSPKQLGEILFTKLKLPIVKRKKSAASTDNEVLEELRHQHPVAEAMIEYRQLAKLKSTYADALIDQINPRTGRVHTSFMQDVARTGRLSSKDPNLQNIPIRREEGRRIRAAFIAAAPDLSLVSADYSQIELRMLAHFCGDRELIAAFERDEDIHAVVAAQVNHVSLDEVTSEMRRQAKAINFGIIYGQSPFGLARELGISKGEAAEFINAYFARYPAVDEFMNRVLEEASREHSVRTISGRKREIEGVRPPARGGGLRIRTMPERVAINTVIQGSAADLIKLAMIRVSSRLRDSGMAAKLLLQIHDELLVECPDHEIDAVALLLQSEMSGAYPLSVPLKVAIEAGKNWNDTTEIRPRQS